MKCPDSDKECHSRGEAEAHLRRLREKDQEYTGVVYPCDRCGFYHVGRERQNAKKNKYKEA